MSTEIYIAEEDVSSYIDFRSITITDGAQSRGDTLAFEMKIPYDELGVYVEKPRPGNVVVVVVDTVKFFEGPVISCDDTFLNSRTMLVGVECSDYTFFLDRKYIAKVELPITSSGERIKTLLGEFASEFCWGEGWDSHIANGLPLPKEGYDYEQFSSVIDRICEATGYGWHVGFDPTTDGRPTVYFYSAIDDVSPLNDDYSNILNIDTNIDIGGVQVREDISNLHNVVIVKDFSEKKDTPYSEKYVADGSQTFFKLPMEPFSVEDTSISVQPGGEGEFIERTVALDPLTGEDDEIIGVPGYAYLCILNWGIRFPTSDYPADGDIIKIDYNYVIPDRIIPLYDMDSINEMARREGNDGEHQVVISLPDYRVDGSGGYNAAEFYGNMILNKHAWPEISGSFEVYEPSSFSGMEGWKAGQNFSLYSEIRDIYDIRHWVRTGRGEKIPVTVWVTSISRTIVQPSSPGNTRFRTKINFSTNLGR